MIKKACLFLLLTACVGSSLFAQDSASYELQRDKINAMLKDRSARFGQYDNSLNTKTGIFGLQTKKDIRNSNEILRQITLSDNDIFTEIKVLLDYKDIQFQQVKSNVDYDKMRIESYKKTIRDLQLKNEELLNYNQKISKTTNYYQLALILMLIVLGVLSFIIYRKNRARKSEINPTRLTEN